MKPEPVDATPPETTPPEPDHRSRRRWLFFLLSFSAIGALSVSVGHRLSTSAVVDLGPTDAHYVRDFREVEKDGGLFFRWSTVPSSRVELPLKFCGPGAIRLRVRRHFPDAALLTLAVSGRVVGQKSVAARIDFPYDIVEFPVPEVLCTSDASILLEATVTNERPLGVALDWIEVQATSGFSAPVRTLASGASIVALTTLGAWISGAGLGCALFLNLGLSLSMAFGFAANPVASERILMGAAGALAFTVVLGTLIAKLGCVIRFSMKARSIIFVVTIATLMSRAAFLHPQSFYPDYRVHALVLETLDSLGLSRFLDQIFEIQYARSLGLQEIGGHWYPFPYPPGSYVLSLPAVNIFGLTALDASIATAVAAASLIPLLTASAGAALGLSQFVCVASAFYVSFQPLLVRRMAFGYFPGVVGQCFDAVALLLLLRFVRTSDSPFRRLSFLAVALLAAFLVYTQSVANFGLLASGLLLVEFVRRSSIGRAGALRIVLAAGVALSAALGMFYWRYQPVLANALNQRTQPESRVLDRLEQLRQNPSAEPDARGGEDLNDPFAATTLNPFRGLARLGSRLWRFNGAFVLAIIMGGWLLWRHSERAAQNLMIAWALVAVWISLLAAGLPSPNSFQHLKDLEFVSPLLALALGFLTKTLWDRRPAWAVLFAAAWAAFAGHAFGVEWTERLLPIVGL